MMRKLYISAAFCLLSAFGYGQENVWTLQQCIDYAMENNLSLMRSQLNVLGAEINYDQARYNRLPNLNGNISYGYNWGRTIDPTTNLFIDNQRLASSNASLNSSVTLFNGLNITNTIKQNELALRSSEYSYADAKNDVMVLVATNYINVLFARELYENAVKQLECTSQQVMLTEKRVNAGALPQANLLDLKAQQATNDLNRVNRENDYNNARIQLKQVLQLPPEQQIQIVLPQVEVEINPVIELSALEIYKIALGEQPDIKAAELNTESAQYGVKAAEGTLYPTLTLNAGLSTQYSSAADRERFVLEEGDPTVFPNADTVGIVAGTGEAVVRDLQIPAGRFESDYPFLDQYDEQLRKFVGFNLSIPIFNRFQARSNVQRAKITQSQADITKQEVRYQLWQTIEQAYNSALAAAKTFESAQRQVDAREESYRIINQRYELGAANFVDYQVAENDLFQAKSDLLRAKYDYIFRLKILDFYQGKPLEL